MKYIDWGFIDRIDVKLSFKRQSIAVRLLFG